MSTPSPPYDRSASEASGWLVNSPCTPRRSATRIGNCAPGEPRCDTDIGNPYPKEKSQSNTTPDDALPTPFSLPRDKERRKCSYLRLFLIATLLILSARFFSTHTLCILHSSPYASAPQCPASSLTRTLTRFHAYLPGMHAHTTPPLPSNEIPGDTHTETHTLVHGHAHDLMRVHADMLSGVLAEGASLAGLVHTLETGREALAALRSRGINGFGGANVSEMIDLLEGEVANAEVALAVLREEVGAVVDAAIQAHTRAHFALAHAAASARAARAVAHVVRRARREAWAALVQGVARLADTSAAAFHALHAVDERLAALRGAAVRENLAAADVVDILALLWNHTGRTDVPTESVGDGKPTTEVALRKFETTVDDAHDCVQGVLAVVGRAGRMVRHVGDGWGQLEMTRIWAEVEILREAKKLWDQAESVESLNVERLNVDQ